jgi:hypothetical protein
VDEEGGERLRSTADGLCVPSRPRPACLVSAARLGERFDDLHFLAFDARLVVAARGASVPVYERA